MPRTFTIYDDADQIAAVKRALDDQGLDPRRIAPRAVLSAISQRQERAPRAREQFAAHRRRLLPGGDRARLPALPGHPRAERRARLRRHPPARRSSSSTSAKTSSRSTPTATRYVLIDEFQDTNIAQYVLAKQWAAATRNICVVGDPDQSIYSWRSADIRNILNFEHDYPDARVVILEQNYRSTQTILDSAHSVIALNKQRKEKNLWTENGRRRPDRRPRGVRRGGRGRLRRRGDQAPAPSDEGATPTTTSPSCTARTPSPGRSRRRSSGAASPTGWSAAPASTSAARSRTCSPTCASSRTRSTPSP